MVCSLLFIIVSISIDEIAKKANPFQAAAIR
jgi:hypothetical protein